MTTSLIQYISRSEELAISWQEKTLISCCVLLLSVTQTFCSLTSTVIRCPGWKSSKPHSKSRHEHIRPLLKALHSLSVKERITFTDGTLPPYLSPCLPVYTPSHILHSSSDEKNLSCAKRKLKGFSYQSFCVLFSGTTFLLTSDIAVLSHFRHTTPA